jgi:hypothetical protein
MMIPRLYVELGDFNINMWGNGQRTPWNDRPRKTMVCPTVRYSSW